MDVTLWHDTNACLTMAQYQTLWHDTDACHTMAQYQCMSHYDTIPMHVMIPMYVTLGLDTNAYMYMSHYDLIPMHVTLWHGAYACHMHTMA